MFTGIIEEIGTVTSIRHGGNSLSMEIRASIVTEGTRPGDSICTDGVCLTATSVSRESLVMDVMPETMKRTTFHLLRPGSRVNLERALRLSDRIGGHLVAGHIDGTGKILARWTDENAEWFRIEGSPEWMRYLVMKGSVAIDGISLTVAGLGSHDFTVSVIPHTRQQTTITEKRAGSPVNIECDLIGKYVERLAAGESGKGLALHLFSKTGFL